MPALRLTRLAVPLASLLVLLSSCTNEAPSSRGNDPSNAGGTGGGSGGSSAGVSGAGGATAGSAGTVGGSSGAGGSVAGAGGLSGSAGTGGAGAASSGGTAGESGAGGSDGSGGDVTFALTSPELSEGSAFAGKHTCAAAGFNGSLSPALEWTPGPEGTKSYAITLIDVTLTQGTPRSELGYHWVLYNIPATVRSLPGEFTNAASIGAAQNRTYLGPCPNFSGGSDTHTYEFTLYALDTETLSITPTTGTGAVKDAEAKLEANHLAVAKLSGTSDASPP
jgi:Raf kinase inhibitor-like YbhB/YbcL family protein